MSPMLQRRKRLRVLSVLVPSTVSTTPRPDPGWWPLRPHESTLGVADPDADADPDVVERSAVIAVGRAAAMQTVRDPRDDVIHTYVTYELDRWLKGESPRRVLVKQQGGQAGDRAQVILGGPRFELGRRDLLFLVRADDDASDGDDGVFTLTCAVAGKQPLADEVLFGKLKKGGTVKVTVKTDESGETGLDLEAIEDGPVKPRPEPVPRRKRAPRKRKSANGKGPSDGKPDDDGGPRGLVPKVPLKTD